MYITSFKLLTNIHRTLIYSFRFLQQVHSYSPSNKFLRGQADPPEHEQDVHAQGVDDVRGASTCERIRARRLQAREERWPFSQLLIAGCFEDSSTVAPYTQLRSLFNDPYPVLYRTVPYAMPNIYVVFTLLREKRLLKLAPAHVGPPHMAGVPQFQIVPNYSVPREFWGPMLLLALGVQWHAHRTYTRLPELTTYSKKSQNSSDLSNPP